MSRQPFSPSRFTTKNISKEDVIQIKSAFDILDADLSGTISPAEIKIFFDSLNLNQSKQAIYEALKEMDENYNGGVEFEEYFRYMTTVYSNKKNKEELAPLLDEEIKTREKKALNVQTKTQNKAVLRSANAPSKEEAINKSSLKQEIPKKAAQPQPVQSVSKSKKGVYNPSNYVRPDLSIEDVTNIKKAFDLVDEDGSGVVSPSEIIKQFDKIGLTQKSQLIYQIVGEWDKDHSGGLDFEEFLKIVSQKSTNSGNSREDLMKYFDFFDENKDGKITWNELKKVAEYLGEEMSDDEVKEMFNKADLDADGLVTQEDFYNIVNGAGYY